MKDTSGPSLLDQLVDAILQSRAAGLSPAVVHEGRRALTNVVGVAVAGARHSGVDSILRGADFGSRDGLVTVPGRPERVDPYSAALAIGFAAHVDDFDDTHLETVIHPSAASLAVLLGAAQLGSDPAQSPRDDLTAFCLGIEVQLRFGLALGPEHYEAGWHTTGTCGVMGAAATAGLVLGLDPDQMRGAIGLAASATLGQREVFGSDGKALHAGKAAANGLLCAMLASAGLHSTRDILDGRRGYFSTLGPGGEPGKLIDGFGSTWALLDLTYKPYPCGIVAHPAIDAAIDYHTAHRLGDIADVRILCNPLVVDLMGVKDPRQGLEARFSTVHAVACGLVDGAFGLDQVTDAACRRADLADMRRRIALVPDPVVERQSASLLVRLRDGREIVLETDAARGSRDRPLSDEEVESKARLLLAGRLGDQRAQDVLESVAECPASGSLTAALSGTAVDGGSPSALPQLVADRPEGSGRVQSKRPVVPVDVTGTLAEFVIGTAGSDIPPEVERMCERTLANAVAVGLLGADEEEIAQARTALGRFPSAGTTGCFGWAGGLPPVHAAIVNGMAMHVLDFDDTYLEGDIHLGAPVIPAALAAAQLVGCDGAALLPALTVGFEVAARVARATHGQQFAQGWHLTSTAGRVGAAAAAARVLGLTAPECVHALGLAATQAGGPRSAFGSPAKAWHAGKAAADGLESALLARAGLTGPDFPLEGRRGYAAILAPGSNISLALDGLGHRWLCERNSFKPYSCGVVAHPAIDAAIDLRRRGVLAQQVERITVGVHPAVIELMGNLSPTNGLQAKFSVTHCVAVGLCDGAAGPAQFTDERVRDPDVSRLRNCVDLCPDATLSRESAWASLSGPDRRVVDARVAHASGSVANPMSDDQLREKARGCWPADPDGIDQLMDTLLNLRQLSSVDDFWAFVHGLSAASTRRTDASDTRLAVAARDREMTE